MLKLLPYLRPFRGLIALSILSNILMSLFQVISIPVLQPFLQILFNRETAPVAPTTGGWSFRNFEYQSQLFFRTLIEEHGKEKALLFVCLAIVFVFFGKNLFRYLSLYFFAPVRNGLVRNLRQDLTRKILKLHLAWLSDERKGDLMSRMTNDLAEVEWSMVGVMEAIIREPVIIIGSLIFMIFISPDLTLFVLLMLAFTGVIIGGIGKSLRKQSNAAQSRLGFLASIIDETLVGLRIIKGFTAEKYQEKRFEAVNRDYASILTKVSRRRDLASPLSEFLGILVMMLLLGYGSIQVFSGKLSAETFITFLYAFFNVIEPMKSFSSAIFSIKKGMGAMERVQSVLNIEEEVKETEQPVPIANLRDKIAFHGVGFRYKNAERNAVEDIHFSLSKGQVIALVGASGAGKSTIADLLPRFYDVTEGSIAVDGVDIRKLNLVQWRKMLGIVTQEAILFNDTIRNNIAFGEEQIPFEQIQAAAQAANAHEFIQALPDGYDTNIGDRGGKLSGGQRQRLTIARALLKNPQVLILDEATSALDSESEKLVQEALDKLMQNRTALVIAHRLSTVQHASEILVMDNGHIVERGTHESLMVKGGIYRKLVELQAL